MFNANICNCDFYYIQNVTESDYGKYYCLAKNSQGETSGEIALYGKEMLKL